MRSILPGGERKKTKQSNTSCPTIARPIGRFMKSAIPSACMLVITAAPAQKLSRQARSSSSPPISSKTIACGDSVRTAIPMPRLLVIPLKMSHIQPMSNGLTPPRAAHISSRSSTTETRRGVPCSPADSERAMSRSMVVFPHDGGPIKRVFFIPRRL